MALYFVTNVKCSDVCRQSAFHKRHSSCAAWLSYLGVGQEAGRVRVGQGFSPRARVMASMLVPTTT